MRYSPWPDWFGSSYPDISRKLSFPHVHFPSVPAGWSVPEFDS